MAFTLEEIARRFGGEVVGDPARRVSSLAPLTEAGPQQLAFLANPKYLPQVEATRAGAVLISADDLAKLAPDAGRESGVAGESGAGGGSDAGAADGEGENRQPDRQPGNGGDFRARGVNGRNFIVTPNPYACFARVAQAFVDLATPKPAPGIHASAHVDAAARVAASAVIGPNVTVEAGAVIGARVRLDANAFVGRGTQIGDDSHLYPGVTVYHGCRIGARAIIHAGAVIGADGFGFAPDFTGEGDARTGEWVKIVQVGGVTIGPDVEIGANTTIDRGAMADTLIDEGVKIDNLVQIGHNCRIGAYTVIAGCAGIAGSTTIGRHCMIGGAVGIAGHVTLADRVVVTAKSGVSKSLLKPGIYTSAFPAVEHADWNRSAALVRNLDRLRERIKALEGALAALSSSVSPPFREEG